MEFHISRIILSCARSGTGISEREPNASRPTSKENFSMIKPLVVGASYPVMGMRMLTRPGLRRYVAIPLLINILVFGVGIWWSYASLTPLITGWVEKAIAWLPDWADWLATLLGGFLWLIFAVAGLIVVFYTFTAIANLIASPFNGLLAEQTEKLLSGQSPDSGTSLWKEIVSAPVQEINKLLYFVLWALPLLVLFLIPGLNVAAPFIWALFSAWMLCLQYVDYPMGNHGIRFKDQRRIMRRDRALGIGFGGVTLVFTLVPVLNFVAMPSAVIGATAMWVERIKGKQ